MNKEFEFLKIINEALDDNSYLGNDCAYLKEENLAISSDILIEDVHFKTSYMTPYEIAQKAVLVNISDVYASGSEIKYLTISLGGKLNCDFIKEFYRGVNDLAKIYNFSVIGGDLVKSDKLVISITAIGKNLSNNLPKRKNAKIGYTVAVCGEFGTSAQGLFNLELGIKKDYFIDFHKKPKLFPELVEKFSKIEKEYALMDSSDGLFDCLEQISTQSGVRIDIDYQKIPKKTQDKDFVLFGGEDYSLVCCLDEKDFIKIPQLVKIGECKSGSDVFVNGEKIEYRGFKHFE